MIRLINPPLRRRRLVVAPIVTRATGQLQRAWIPPSVHNPPLRITGSSSSNNNSSSRVLCRRLPAYSLDHALRLARPLLVVLRLRFHGSPVSLQRHAHLLLRLCVRLRKQFPISTPRPPLPLEVLVPDPAAHIFGLASSPGVVRALPILPVRVLSSLWSIISSLQKGCTPMKCSRTLISLLWKSVWDEVNLLSLLLLSRTM
jgi:hypothetical protein